MCIRDSSHCELCPRRCGANRGAGAHGVCGADAVNERLNKGGVGDATADILDGCDEIGFVFFVGWADESQACLLYTSAHGVRSCLIAGLIQEFGVHEFGAQGCDVDVGFSQLGVERAGQVLSLIHI